MVESVVVMAVFGVGAALILRVLAIALAEQRAREEKRKAGCAARGWRYQGREGSRRWRIEGDFDGIPFEAEASRATRNSQSTTSNKGSTRLVLPAEAVEGVVLAGPKLPSLLASMNFGGSMVAMLLRFLLGDDAAQLANVEEVAHGDAAFRESFTVLSDDADLVRDVLDQPTREALLRAREASRGEYTPIVFRWRNRYEVRLQKALEDFEDIERLIELGRELNN